MAVTGQDLPGLNKPNDHVQRRDAALTRWWNGISHEAAKGAFGVSRFLGAIVFGSLTRRIVVLNLVALAVLVGGILYLNQWRAGLIDSPEVRLPMTQVSDVLAARIDHEIERARMAA